MSRIWPIVSVVLFAPLLANCGGGDVVLQRQTQGLMVAPDAVVLSASAGTSVPFGVADTVANGGAITLSQGSCTGIATYGASVDGHAAHAMTIGSNPGVQVNTGGSAYSVAPLGQGKCLLRLNDALGNVATIFVTVTP